MIYFLIVLDAGSLRSLCQYSWVLVKTLPDFQTATSPCPHMREKERVSSVSPYKDMNPIMRTLMTSSKHPAAKSLQSCPTLCDPIDGSHQAPQSLGFSRQEHWSGLPFPSPMQESEKWKWSRSVCPTLCDPVDCSLPGSSIHGIFQARVLEWSAIAFSDNYLLKSLVFRGTFLVIQWLRLCTPDARGLGSIPGQGTRSHMPQLKILPAETETFCSQIIFFLSAICKWHHNRYIEVTVSKYELWEDTIQSAVSYSSRFNHVPLSLKLSLALESKACSGLFFAWCSGSMLKQPCCWFSSEYFCKRFYFLEQF